MKRSIFFRRLIMLTFIIQISLISGCLPTGNNDSETSSRPATKAEKRSFKVALSNSYVGNSWRAEMVRIFDAYAEQKKAEGIIDEAFSVSSGNDPQAQISEIRGMISKGFDAILVNAASPTALAPILNEASDLGIIVVAFDNTVDSDKIYNVNSDQHQFGIAQAEWLMKQINGKGNILVIKGVEGTTVSRDRVQAYKEVLGGYPEVHVLQEGFGNWDYASTGEEIEKMLAAHANEKIDGILTEGSGEVAIVEAELKHGLNPAQIPITGDFQNGCFRMMKEYTVKAIAVGQPPYLSAAALDIALRALKGEKVEKTTILPLPVATYEEVDKWYASDLPDDFYVNWTDPENSYRLKLEQVFNK